MNKKIQYIYPKLPSEIDFYFFRFGGSGLANCMFIAARSYIIAKQKDIPLITPTWIKFSPGPYIRKEKDKRHYAGLFKPSGISGFKKIVLLLTKKRINSDSIQSGIIEEYGLQNYFEDLIPYYELVASYFNKIIRTEAIKKVNEYDFTRCIGIHIRLGDYNNELRTDIEWYINIIQDIENVANGRYRYLLFSDGNDEELLPLLKQSMVERVFFGNAFSDIIALSKCHLIVGSDSTFSGWGAFLGQCPVIFPRKHFGRVLINQEKEITTNGKTHLPDDFLSQILNQSYNIE